jgi:hypothetical protein
MSTPFYDRVEAGPLLAMAQVDARFRGLNA